MRYKKFYDTAKDKNVAATVIYVDTEGYSYDDPETRGDKDAVPVEDADMLNLFVKGVIIIDADGVYNKPVAYSEDDGFILYAPAEESDAEKNPEVAG